MLEPKRSGLRKADVGIVVVVGVVAVVVAFAALHVVVGAFWFAIKLVVVVALITAALRLVLRRR